MLTDARVAPAGPATPCFAALRAREFARLDAGGHAYLDYTGAAPYPASLVAAHHALLEDALLGNPHSENPASLASSALIAEAKARLLRSLDADADEYEVCFTANATGAIRLVAEGWPFTLGSPLVLSADNHNSVNGMREWARRAGARVQYLPLDEHLELDDPEARLRAWSRTGGGGLVAFPAQSNFAGVRHPLSLVEAARSLGHAVLLDAAAYLPANRLSLRTVPADFVALSFYKMFGYPTGLGALVARRESLVRLRRPWFAGGTVDFVSVQGDTHQLRPGADGFEDGTADFLGIAAVRAGLDFLDAVGLERLRDHAGALARLLAVELCALRRRDGRPLVRIYAAAAPRGATVTFNVFDADGAAIPWQVVERRARERRISVRGGCFCNPGAAEAAFGFPRERTAHCLARARRDGWSIDRFGECMRGYAVGAVRASLGMASNEEDVRRLVRVVDEVGNGNA